MTTAEHPSPARSLAALVAELRDLAGVDSDRVAELRNLIARRCGGRPEAGDAR